MEGNLFLKGDTKGWLQTISCKGKDGRKQKKLIHSSWINILVVQKLKKKLNKDRGTHCQRMIDTIRPQLKREC